MKTPNKEYTAEQYNELYSNTLIYLLLWEKKFIYLLQASLNINKAESFKYLNIVKQFVKDLELSYGLALRKYNYWK